MPLVAFPNQTSFINSHINRNNFGGASGCLAPGGQKVFQGQQALVAIYAHQEEKK